MTNPDATNSYLNARAEFARADAKIDALASIVEAVKIGLTLQRAHFMFSNAGPMPASVGLNPRHHRVPKEDWPTVEQMQNALGEWHRALDAMNQAWDQVSPDVRDGLQPPL